MTKVCAQKFDVSSRIQYVRTPVNYYLKSSVQKRSVSRDEAGEQDIHIHEQPTEKEISTVVVGGHLTLTYMNILLPKLLIQALAQRSQRVFTSRK